MFLAFRCQDVIVFVELCGPATSTLIAVCDWTSEVGDACVLLILVVLRARLSWSAPEPHGFGHCSALGHVGCSQESMMDWPAFTPPQS